MALPKPGKYCHCLSLPYQLNIAKLAALVFHTNKNFTHGKAFLKGKKYLGFGFYNRDYSSTFWKTETLAIAKEALLLIEEFKIAWNHRVTTIQEIKINHPFLSKKLFTSK